MNNENRSPLTIHLISHNHWDREWIFTARYTNRWLPPFFANVFAMLEREPAYRFVLDGQTAIIEDCLSQLPPDEIECRRGTEFEILPEQGTIALTLLRGVGWLTR